MNEPNTNLYVILLLITKFFPKSVFQVQQLITLWEDTILVELPENLQQYEQIIGQDGNPIWKSRVAKAITELQKMNYIQRAYPYSMQYQRYTVTQLGTDDITVAQHDIKNRISGDELQLSIEIEKLVQDMS